MKHRNLLTATAVVALLTLIGCSTNPKPKPLPAGAFTETDANFYDALATARGAIDGACQTGTSVKTGTCKLKPELAKYKAQFNLAIHSWNVAAAAEMTYRDSLKNGGTPDSNVVATAVAQATADVAAFVTAISSGN